MDRSHVPRWSNLTEGTQPPTIETIHPSFDLDAGQHSPFLGVGESMSPKLDESVSCSENALTAMDGTDQPDWLTNNPSSSNIIGSLLNNQYENDEGFSLDDFDFNSCAVSPHGSTASTVGNVHHTISAPVLPSRPATLSRSEPIAELAAPDSTDAMVPICPKGQKSAKPRGRPKQDKLICNAATDKDPQTTNRPSCSQAAIQSSESCQTLEQTVPTSLPADERKRLAVKKSRDKTKRENEQIKDSLKAAEDCNKKLKLEVQNLQKKLKQNDRQNAILENSLQLAGVQATEDANEKLVLQGCLTVAADINDSLLRENDLLKEKLTRKDNEVESLKSNVDQLNNQLVLTEYLLGEYQSTNDQRVSRP